MTSETRISDLTVAELKALIRSTVREVLAEDVRAETAPSPLPQQTRSHQHGILDLPAISLGGLVQGAALISREEYYADDGR